MFIIINGVYIILKNELFCFFFELFVGLWLGDVLRFEVCCDVFFFFGVVLLIKQSEGILWMYWLFEYGVVFFYLNLNEKVKLGYVLNNLFFSRFKFVIQYEVIMGCGWYCIELIVGYFQFLVRFF